MNRRSHDATLPPTDTKLDPDQHLETTPDGDAKNPDVIEGLETQGQYESIKPKPDSIANLSETELAAIEKKMVRKIDLVLLPLVGFLYILNCTLWQNDKGGRLII